MAMQYRIGDFFVDLSRNQITRKEQYQTIAPKALAVLTYLAENQGKVVSYDELLSAVWPDIVVTPNTLQRSIAQLRKALGEDSKIQSYIKTHAKQGYSLECDVQWNIADELPAANKSNIDVESNSTLESHLENDQEQKSNIEQVLNPQASIETKQAVNNSIKKSETSRALLKLIFTIIVIIITAIGITTFTSDNTSQLTFNKLRSLTATDDKEFGAIYTPDEKYIIFNRYIGQLCTNNIWAKNLKTQQEIKLTKTLGSYSGITLSDDGETLAFVETADCRKPSNEKKCYNLMSLDIGKALKNPQVPNLIMQCKNSRIYSPKWLDDDHIALFQKQSNRLKLINYSISENRSTDLYELESGNLIHFTYSSTEELIAVISIHDDGKHYIDMLNPNGDLLSSHNIKYPKEISKYKYIYPNFDPRNEQLIFSTGKQLFTLSYDGEINKLNFPFDDLMGAVRFHPNGKRLLLIKARYDSDIASIPYNEPSRKEVISKTAQDLDYSIIERSILGEEHALFQPNGSLIAFISERSGENQIWITGNSSLRQMTQFPVDSYIRGVNWSADGKSLLVNNNNELTQVFLDTTQRKFPLEFRIEQLFQWNSEQGTALLNMRINGTSKFAEVNLMSSEFKVIKNSSVKWALTSEDERLVYTDQLNRFWQPGPAEDQLIELLNGQNGLDRFIMKGNVVYSVNDKNKLWSYDLDTSLFEIIREMPENIDYLTDISETLLLLELRISAKKEVVELSTNE